MLVKLTFLAIAIFFNLTQSQWPGIYNCNISNINFEDLERFYDIFYDFSFVDTNFTPSWWFESCYICDWDISNTFIECDNSTMNNIISINLSYSQLQTYLIGELPHSNSNTKWPKYLESLTLTNQNQINGSFDMRKFVHENNYTSLKLFNINGMYGLTRNPNPLKQVESQSIIKMEYFSISNTNLNVNLANILRVFSKASNLTYMDLSNNDIFTTNEFNLSLWSQLSYFDARNNSAIQGMITMLSLVLVCFLLLLFAIFI